MNEWRTTFYQTAADYSRKTGRYAYYEHQRGNGNWLVVGTTKKVSDANGYEMYIEVTGYRDACGYLEGMLLAMELNGFEKYDG